MSDSPRLLGLALTALVLFAGGCGGQTGDEGGVGNVGVGAAGILAAGGAGGQLGSDGSSGSAAAGMDVPAAGSGVPRCQPPENPVEDRQCMACLGGTCCEQCTAANASASSTPCLNNGLQCVRDCFASRVGDASAESSWSIATDCARQCGVVGPDASVSNGESADAELLHCVIGGADPDMTDDDAGIALDASVAEQSPGAVCLQICFPQWR